MTNKQTLPAAEPSNSWQETAAANNYTSDVFNITEIDKGLVTKLLIESSFFLPNDILRNKSYRVSPIACLELADFAVFYEIISEMENVKIHSDTKYQLLAYAKFIGISARKDFTTGVIHIVLKLWYGNKPHRMKGFNHEYESRKQSLYTFIESYGAN